MNGTFDDIIRKVLGMSPSRSEWYPPATKGEDIYDTPIDVSGAPIANVPPTTARVPPDSLSDVAPIVATEGISTGSPVYRNLASSMHERAHTMWPTVVGDANVMLMH